MLWPYAHAVEEVQMAGLGPAAAELLQRYKSLSALSQHVAHIRRMYCTITLHEPPLQVGRYAACAQRHVDGPVRVWQVSDTLKQRTIYWLHGPIVFAVTEYSAAAVDAAARTGPG